MHYNNVEYCRTEDIVNDPAHAFAQAYGNIIFYFYDCVLLLHDCVLLLHGCVLLLHVCVLARGGHLAKLTPSIEAWLGAGGGAVGLMNEGKMCALASWLCTLASWLCALTSWPCALALRLCRIVWIGLEWNVEDAEWQWVWDNRKNSETVVENQRDIRLK